MKALRAVAFGFTGLILRMDSLMQAQSCSNTETHITELKQLELLYTGTLMQPRLLHYNGFSILVTITGTAGTIAKDFPTHHTHKNISPSGLLAPKIFVRVIKLSCKERKPTLNLLERKDNKTKTKLNILLTGTQKPSRISGFRYGLMQLFKQKL